jgi:hypothetical protein
MSLRIPGIRSSARRSVPDAPTLPGGYAAEGPDADEGEADPAAADGQLPALRPPRTEQEAASATSALVNASPANRWSSRPDTGTWPLRRLARFSQHDHQRTICGMVGMLCAPCGR